MTLRTLDVENVGGGLRRYSTGRDGTVEYIGGRRHEISTDSWIYLRLHSYVLQIYHKILPRQPQEEHSANDDITLMARVKSLVDTKHMRLLTGVQAVIWCILGVVYMYIPLRVDTFR